MKILYEDFHEPEIISESNDSGKKKYKIRGVFSTIGEKNRNGRIYPEHLWKREVDKYQEVIKSGSINRLCEWEHPERTNVDIMEAVAAIEDLHIEGNKVIGTAVLLDNPKATQLKSLIDNGIKISVSSRGVGNVGKNGIVDEFNLITYDLVSSPSDHNATMSGLVESTKEFELKDGKYIESKNTSKANVILDFIKKLK